MNRAVLLLAGLAAAGASSAGCMLLVSDGDYNAGAAPLDAGPGNGLDAGSPGRDAGHVVGVDAGGGGGPDAGTDGGGASGDGSPSVCTPPDLTASDRVSVIKACMLMSGCTPWFFPPTTLSTCISYDHPALAQHTRCTTAATTCAQYEQCTGIGPAPASAACANTATPSYKCAGTQAVTCGGNLATDPSNGYAYDCAVRGGQCQTYAGGVGCVMESSCSTPASTNECGTSNDLYTCIGGVGFGVNCADAFNATCSTGSDGTSCYYPLQPCASGAGDSCNGSIAIQCDSSSGNKQIQYNCGAMGLSCGATTANSLHCLGSGCTPSDESSCAESCDADGTHINLCVGGAPVKLSCTDYGFSRCASYNADAANGFPNPFSLCIP
jgi:hypothetical protein